MSSQRQQCRRWVSFRLALPRRRRRLERRRLELEPLDRSVALLRLWVAVLVVCGPLRRSVCGLFLRCTCRTARPPIWLLLFACILSLLRALFLILAVVR